MPASIVRVQGTSGYGNDADTCAVAELGSSNRRLNKRRRGHCIESADVVSEVLSQ